MNINKITRVGAYTFILEKVLLNIIALKEIPGINMKQMAEIFYVVQDVSGLPFKANITNPFSS